MTTYTPVIAVIDEETLQNLHDLTAKFQAEADVELMASLAEQHPDWTPTMIFAGIALREILTEAAEQQRVN